MAQSQILRVRVTHEEAQAIEDRATKDGLSVPAWIRRQLFRRAGIAGPPERFRGRPRGPNYRPRGRGKTVAQ